MQVDGVLFAPNETLALAQLTDFRDWTRSTGLRPLQTRSRSNMLVRPLQTWSRSQVAMNSSMSSNANGIRARSCSAWRWCCWGPSGFGAEATEDTCGWDRGRLLRVVVGRGGGGSTTDCARPSPSSTAAISFFLAWISRHQKKKKKKKKWVMIKIYIKFCSQVSIAAWTAVDLFHIHFLWVYQQHTFLMGISTAYISYGYINSIHFLWVYQQHTFLMGISTAYISYGYINSIHFLWVYQQHTFLMGISTAAPGIPAKILISGRWHACTSSSGSWSWIHIRCELHMSADWSIPWQRSCDMSEGLINSDSKCKWTESRNSHTLQKWQFRQSYHDTQAHVTPVTVQKPLTEWSFGRGVQTRRPRLRQTVDRINAYVVENGFRCGTGAHGGASLFVLEFHWLVSQSYLCCLFFEEVHLLRCDPTSSFDHACKTVHYRDGKRSDGGVWERVWSGAADSPMRTDEKQARLAQHLNFFKYFSIIF